MPGSGSSTSIRRTVSSSGAWRRSATWTPWGLAMARELRAFGGDLLVGNFGDGRINAFAPMPNGKFVFRGQLESEGAPLSIDGLWSLRFSSDAAAGPRRRCSSPRDQRRRPTACSGRSFRRPEARIRSAPRLGRGRPDCATDGVVDGVVVVRDGVGVGVGVGEGGRGGVTRGSGSLDHPHVQERASRRCVQSRPSKLGAWTRWTRMADRDRAQEDHHRHGTRAALGRPERDHLDLAPVSSETEQRRHQPPSVGPNDGDVVGGGVAPGVRLHDEVPEIPDRAHGPRGERRQPPGGRARVVEAHLPQVQPPPASCGSTWSEWSASTGSANAVSVTTPSAAIPSARRLNPTPSEARERNRPDPHPRARDRGRRGRRGTRSAAAGSPSERTIGSSSPALHATNATAARATLRPSSSR